MEPAMNLQEMIEAAVEKIGSQKELAMTLGIDANNLASAKGGRRGLPAIACGKLGDILGIDKWTVVAASELVTEKSEEKRAYFSPFVLELPKKAAMWAIAAVTLSSIGVAPNDAQAQYANDTFNVSPTPLKPAPLSQNANGIMYIM
jgi:hypothetical protein